MGHVHGAQTRHIVGAIANEGGIDSKLIGRIEIFDQYSTVDLPEGLTPEILRALQKTRLYGQAFKTTRWDESLPLPENKPESAPPARPAKDEKPRPEKKKKEKEQPKETESQKPEWGMERYRVEVGESHGVKPSQIIGAISNEGGLDPQYVGKIELFADYSLVDLPEGMPRDILRIWKKARVMGQALIISRLVAPRDMFNG
ncbi:MAG: DbpA RNA binding domain-containing protein, partial [bacterium]|nr:DbpA RNA binding domain-containing protein [bacterium]